jgi:hypothetical protein
MIPQCGDRLPLVMVLGASLTDKSWEATPEGRMGWDEDFVRKGHPVYVPDEVGRGRSGYNQAFVDNVRTGSAPPSSLPYMPRFSDEVVWTNFRFDSNPGDPFPSTCFAVSAVEELSKQGVPDARLGGRPATTPPVQAWSDLVGQGNGAVLLGRSRSGAFPLAAALLNSVVREGLVLFEPWRCPANYKAREIKTLATLPVPVVFGDHRDTPTGFSTQAPWKESFDSCLAFIGSLKFPGADGYAESARPGDTGKQSHDPAGQELPKDRRPDPAVDR